MYAPNVQCTMYLEGLKMYYVIGASVPSLHRESTAFSNNFLKEIYYLHGFIKFVKDFVVKRFSHAVYMYMYMYM